MIFSSYSSVAMVPDAQAEAFSWKPPWQAESKNPCPFTGEGGLKGGEPPRTFVHGAFAITVRHLAAESPGCSSALRNPRSLLVPNSIYPWSGHCYPFPMTSAWAPGMPWRDIQEETRCALPLPPLSFGVNPWPLLTGGSHSTLFIGACIRSGHTEA